MPIRATPYKHQIEAFNFVCGKFGLVPANGMASSGAALLMEMGTGKRSQIAVRSPLSSGQDPQGSGSGTAFYTGV
jgi:hypothetical protein